MAVIPGTYGIKVGNLGGGQAKVAVGLYDFATQGGAVGAITLSGEQVPSGAVITDSLIITDTILAGGTVTDTVQVGVEGAADIQAAAARNALPWSTTGPKRGSLTATSAPVRTTVARSIVATISATVLTAGKFRVVVTYIEAP